MDKALVVRGTMSDSRHIELDEPVTGLGSTVEVVLRAVPPQKAGVDVFDFIAGLRPGTRSKDDIDRQVQEEHDAWAD